MTQSSIPCFKAYDIRGRVPDDLDENLAYSLGRAYAKRFSPRKVAIGQDIRDSSPALARAVTEGLLHSGVDVIDIGLCGTELTYFAAMHLENEGVDGAIMVTASHNPKGYNGMKLVQKGAVPISGDSGLGDLEQMILAEDFAPKADESGKRTTLDLTAPYIAHLLTYVDVEALKPLTLVVNAGNGCAGPWIDAIEDKLPFTFHKVHHAPDGTFPHGGPNPLLEENRAPTIAKVKEVGADLGIAWDGDFDRCFFFDHEGTFVDGYYIVGLFAEEMLRLNPGAAIIHDPRLVWNTVEMVERAGGRAVMSKTGHAFIKERMRKEDAAYGGEMSAHHYFREFAYCDSGMIPWLLMCATMSRTGKTLKDLVAERQAAFPSSGEINRKLEDPKRSIAAVRARYTDAAEGLDETDGLSLDMGTWRFNLRVSNTEPILRLNVESRGDRALMEQKTAELLGVIDAA